MTDETEPLTSPAVQDMLVDLEIRMHDIEAEKLRLRKLTSRNDREWIRGQKDQKDLRKLLNICREIEETPDRAVVASKDHVSVSDHAVIRYLERRYGFDFEEVRGEILTPAVRSAIRAGAAGVKVDGGVFKIQQKRVVTYITGNEPRRR